MFGLDKVDAATKWLQAEPGRAIEITYDSNFRVEFDDSGKLTAYGKGDSLMDALKVALAGLPK